MTLSNNDAHRLNAAKCLLDLSKIRPELQERIDVEINRLLNKSEVQPIYIPADDATHNDILVLQLLGRTVVDASTNNQLIEGAINLLINKRDSLTKSKSFLFANSLSVLKYVNSITESDVRSLTVTSNSREVLLNYFTGELGLPLSSINKLPIFETSRGKTVAPSWAKSGFVRTIDGAEIPIVNDGLSIVLASLSDDHILYDTCALTVLECSGADAVFQWLIRTNFANKHWNKDSKESLESIITAFKVLQSVNNSFLSRNMSRRTLLRCCCERK
jgi:hypothetical protein